MFGSRVKSGSKKCAIIGNRSDIFWTSSLSVSLTSQEFDASLEGNYEYSFKTQ